MSGCALAIDLRTPSKFDIDSATPYLALASIANEIDPSVYGHTSTALLKPQLRHRRGTTTREKSATALTHYMERRSCSVSPEDIQTPTHASDGGRHCRNHPPWCCLSLDDLSWVLGDLAGRMHECRTLSAPFIDRPTPTEPPDAGPLTKLELPRWCEPAQAFVVQRAG
jgi:hypothetical protein